MSAIEDYLDDVCRAMGGSFTEQEAVRDELRTHILDAVRDLQTRGNAAEAALSLALREMGEAETVGRRLRGSRGSAPLRRPLFQAEGALLLGRRRAFAGPSLVATIAIAAAGAAALLVMLVFLWPR